MTGDRDKPQDEQQLVLELQHHDENVRNRATRKLWELWFSEHGQDGMEAFHQSALCIEQNDFAKAEQVLTELITRLPNYSEAYNQRVIVRFKAQHYRTAIEDCEKTLALRPWHSGALYGLGLCHRALGQFAAAVDAFERALKVQPYAPKEMLNACRAKLN